MIQFVILCAFSSVSLFAEKNESAPRDVKTYTEMKYNSKSYKLRIRAPELKQGNLAVMKIIPEEQNLGPEHFKVTWMGSDLRLEKYKESLVSLIPISPEASPYESLLVIEKKSGNETEIKKFRIPVEKTAFQTRKMYSELKVPTNFKTRKYSDETLTFIQKCEEKKKAVFSAVNNFFANGKFVKPLKKIYVTSPFYVKRMYRPNDKGKPHGGIDFRGRKGEKIYAIQDGKVAIAEKMFFEGNFTVIDHGLGMFSLYMHQSKMHVKEGEFVKKGTLIGEVGSTGMSTGPHLHLGLKVNGTMVNPLKVIGLPLL